MQLPLPVGINPQLLFDNFIVGKNTYLIQNILLREKKLCEVLYIYGQSYGKTHLLQALANKLQNEDIIYFDLKHNNISDFAEVVAHAKIIVLDNLEATDINNQKTIFDLYNNSINNFNLIITGKTNIKHQDILVDLQTRISQSLNIEIQALSDSEQIQALTLRAKNKNMNIAEDIFKYLQKNYSRDLKELMQFLDTLSETSLITQQKITKKMIKSLI